MIQMIKHWQGPVEINGVEYESAAQAISAFKPVSDDIYIILKVRGQKPVNQPTGGEKATIEQVAGETEYKIMVKPYMTKPATPEFDFMAKWNDNKPMPMRIMAGTVEKETRGMAYMHLHGMAEETITCMCCGKELTNPISRHYGIGPVCMSKVGIVADIDDVEAIKEKLVEVTWSGWVIKSAILSKEEI